MSGDTSALLMERSVPGDPLTAVPSAKQDVVVAGLLRRLWQPPSPGHQFRPPQQMCDEWVDEYEAKVARTATALDPGLARAGIALFRALSATTDRSVLLCTDLHAGNVLAARREPWLVIDPKPYVGDPAYDPLQHMLNNDDRLLADPAGLARRMAGLLELDPGRVLKWLFARCVQESPDRPELCHSWRERWRRTSERWRRTRRAVRRRSVGRGRRVVRFAVWGWARGWGGRGGVRRGGGRCARTGG
ncbi:MAG: aminoglycoside phosphotransferase family protein [Actinomycetes bacterium]